MSATNLDLPVLISADQIRRREFVTTRRGYDPDQVRAYLGQLADQIELMRVLLQEAQQEAQTAIRTGAQPQEDPYEKLAQRVSSVIREADQAAQTIRGEAATDAERLTREARADADRMRTDAQAKAEEARALADRAVRNAREEADRTIAGLSTRRDALVDQLASMQERLIGVARDLETALDVQVSLPALPSIEDLFDDSTQDRGEPAASPSNGAVSAPAPPTTADAPAENGQTAEDAVDDASSESERPIVIGEAAPLAYNHVPEDEPPVMDPSYEELWEGTDAMRLDLPDIPALDLDWGEEDDRA
jgi:DivIVA domain-containing protein